MKSTTGIRTFLLAATFGAVVAGSSFAGTITGIVNYEGDVPEPEAIAMDTDEVCASKHSEPVYTQSLVLGEGQTMANVFVHVTGGLPDREYPVPAEPLELNQAGCEYVPHVFGIRAGQPLAILNPDGTLHNIHALCRENQEFNMAMPKFRKKAVRTFDREESMFPIKCDVHSWMGAWCAVLSHPFFHVTEKDGTFTIEGLDAGTYEIEAWHEKLGTQTATVTIGADEATTANFTFTGASR